MPGLLILAGAISQQRVSALTVLPSPCTAVPPLTCPTPLPSILPSPTATPSQATGAPAPSSTSGNPVAAQTARQAAAGPLAAQQSADLIVLQSALNDSGLAARLLEIQQQPVAAQRPDLLHFTPAGQSIVSKLRSATPWAPPLVLLLAWVALVPLAVRRARVRAARGWIAVAALGLAVSAAGVGPVPAASRGTQPNAIPSRTLTNAPAPQGSAQVERLRRQADPWLSLVRIERRLRMQQAALAADESRLDMLVAGIENGTARARGGVLAHLVQSHDSDAAAYDQTLEDEYQLYQAAASQPALQAQLTSGAAADPAAARAVSTDVSRVATQLRQEQEIAASISRLQQRGQSPGQSVALTGADSFIAPVGGPVVQPFGPTSFAAEPPIIYDDRFYPHFHTGVDIASPSGTPVAAAADGVVALVATSTDGHGHLTGYGNYVVIAHGHGYYTLYAHLSAALVTAGQVVRQGQAIALVGSTGNSTGPHLHFEVRRDGVFVDPLPFLAGGQKPW